MKKTFISPVADVKAMETAQMICSSTLSIDDTPVSGTSENHFQAGAKTNGNMSTFGRMATWAMGKLDF